MKNLVLTLTLLFACGNAFGIEECTDQQNIEISESVFLGEQMLRTRLKLSEDRVKYYLNVAENMVNESLDQATCEATLTKIRQVRASINALVANLNSTRL